VTPGLLPPRISRKIERASRHQAALLKSSATTTSAFRWTEQVTLPCSNSPLANPHNKGVDARQLFATASRSCNRVGAGYNVM
jgi:hypothetical protein